MDAVHKRYQVTEPDLSEREWDYLSDAFRSGWVSSQGSYLARFEQAFADFCQVRFCESTSNGTTALHLALLALGVGPGDEVIVPSLTFAASTNAIVHAGATPVFVDVDPDTWCIDPAATKAKITNRTRAIMVVHLYGAPADMNAISELAEAHDLYVIEDAAEAHGATHRGRPVGGIGTVGCFSFFGNKIMTTGEGGAVLCNSPEIAARVRLLKNHGMDPQRRYFHQVVGYNYRMTNLQAALGLAQLERFPDLAERKRTVFGWYDERMRDLHGIRLHHQRIHNSNACWLYSIVLDASVMITRDAFGAELADQGIDTRPFFYPNHLLPPFMGLTDGSLPVSEFLGERGLNLPSSGRLQEADVDYICDRVRRALRR
jgi:perosamine synthetase